MIHPATRCGGIHVRYENERAVPSFDCDACGEPITDAGLGMFLWDDAVDRLSRDGAGRDGAFPTYFLHKGSCDRAFCAAHEITAACWEEMERLPMYLCNNLGINTEAKLLDVIRGARLMAAL